MFAVPQGLGRNKPTTGDVDDRDPLDAVGQLGDLGVAHPRDQQDRSFPLDRWRRAVNDVGVADSGAAQPARLAVGLQERALSGPRLGPGRRRAAALLGRIVLVGRIPYVEERVGAVPRHRSDDQHSEEERDATDDDPHGVRLGQCWYVPTTIARASVLNARLKETTAGDASESTPRLS